MADLFQINSAIMTNQGQKRTNNEDYLSFYEPGDPKQIISDGNLYTVADGVGGEASGELASRYAAEKVVYDYFHNSQMPPHQRLETSMTEANQDIQQFTSSASLSRMATTLVAAVIRHNRLTVANVGDSRAYLIRDGQVQQITQDHNLVGEMERAGIISEQEAMDSNVKNRLMRSIGGHPDFKVDIFLELDLKPGDRILLCTDGLTRYATRTDIINLSNQGTPQEVVQRMIRFANDRGGADNISVVFIEIGEPVRAMRPHEPRGIIPAPTNLEALANSMSITIEATQPITTQPEDMQTEASVAKTMEIPVQPSSSSSEKTTEIQPSSNTEPTQQIQISTSTEKTQQISQAPSMQATQQIMYNSTIPNNPEPPRPPQRVTPVPVAKPAPTGRPVNSSRRMPPPDPFARKRAGGANVGTWLLLVIFLALAVFVLVFAVILFQKNASNTEALAYTQTAIASVARQTMTALAQPTATRPKPTATTAPIAVDTTQETQETTSTTPDANQTAAAPTATGATSLNEVCIKRPDVSIGQGLASLLDSFGVTYSPFTTYNYYLCDGTGADLKCGSVKEIAPTDHGNIQEIWYIVLPGIDEATCTSKNGTWLKK